MVWISSVPARSLAETCALQLALLWGQRRPDGTIALLDTYRISQPLPLNRGQTWKQVWHDNNYEQRCYDEFWSKNLNVLDALQADAISAFKEGDHERNMADTLNFVLDDIEDRYRDLGVHYVTDTLNFDMIWLNTMLLQRGHPSLLYYRNGKYGVDSYELGSYIYGFLRIDPGNSKLAWAQIIKPFKARLAQNLQKFAPAFVHDHRPENDAGNIMAQFLLVGQTSVE